MGDGGGQMPGLGGAGTALCGVRANFGVSALFRSQQSLYVEVLGPCPLLSPPLSPSCYLSPHFQVSFSFFSEYYFREKYCLLDRELLPSVYASFNCLFLAREVNVGTMNGLRYVFSKMNR